MSSVSCLKWTDASLSHSERSSVPNRGMTHCSDNEKDEQSDDDGAQRLQENLKKTSKGGKHVSFPPDGQIVSGFAEHKNADRKGKLQYQGCLNQSVFRKMLNIYFASLSSPTCFATMSLWSSWADEPETEISQKLLTSEFLHNHSKCWTLRAFLTRL